MRGLEANETEMRGMTATASTALDQTAYQTDVVTREIVRGKMLAVADEMAVVLSRSSMSPVIYEVLDFACGFCTADGELVAQSNGITVFTGTFSNQVTAIRRKFGDAMAPGDIYMVNDPDVTGTHYNDVSILKPIYIDGGLFAFAISISHWTDVGGKAPGSLPADATEIFQEGICFPGVKLYDRGVRQDAIHDMITANMRIPKMAMGDLNASLASVRIAEARCMELCDKYGKTAVSETFRHILKTSEQISRQAIAALPDGTYTAEDWIDGDGITEERFPIKVAATISGDTITFDYTGSSPQVQGPINCARGALVSAVKTVFKAIIDPQGPSNEGWFRPLEVVAPDATVFTAQKPAPVGWYYEGTGMASEVAWKAMAQVVPERVSMGSANSLCVTVLGGTENGQDDPWVMIETNMVGWGATDERDGSCVTSAITDGDTFNYSIELLEANFPLRCHKYALNTESGVGAGRHRGGYGAIREYELLADQTVLSASFGRSQERPWGGRDGDPGSCNYFEFDAGQGRRRMARAPTTILRRGDHLSIHTGGGGGYGDPLERPPEEVLEEVRADYITRDEAREQYGVVVQSDGRSIDADATQRLRAAQA